MSTAIVKRARELGLDRHERDQLLSIGGGVYGHGNRSHPYWWGKKTMPKLAARGLVEAHPDYPGAWRITNSGAALYDDLRRA